MINKFLGENSTVMRLARTIVQGVISAVAGILAYYSTNNPVMAVVVTPLTMSVLSPIMSELGKINGGAQ